MLPRTEGTDRSEPTVRIVPEFLRSLLVIAPHPDDETIAAGGLIHALCRLGHRVRVVVVSDGGASHPNSRLYRPAALAAMRRTESVAAMERLGLAARNVHFCDFQDGGSLGWESDPIPLSRLSAALYGSWDAVALPSEFDLHPDHAKTRELAKRFLGPRRLELAYTVWPQDGTEPPTDAEHVLDMEAVAAKRAAMRCYRSQLGGVPDDPEGFVIDDGLFARFTQRTERFALTRHTYP